MLLCVILAAALPAVVSAAPGERLTCGLSFDSAHDATECVFKRGLYTIPSSGGDVTLQVGIYSEHMVDHPPTFGSNLLGYWSGLTLSSSTHVMIEIYNGLDRSTKLFTFEGTLADLLALPGGGVAFAGPYGVLVRIPLTVPAGTTWWSGRMEVVMGGYRCHADILLFEGMGIGRPKA